MPVGPLHLGFTLPAFARFRERLEFLPLAIGTFIADLELLLMLPVVGNLEDSRGCMHSLVGALTVDLLFALAYAYWVAPPLVAWFAAKYPGKGYGLFASKDISAPPRSLAWSAASALLGTVSHVLIDLFSHVRNPLLWPWGWGEGLNLMPLGRFPSTILMHALAAALLFWVLKRHWRA